MSFQNVFSKKKRRRKSDRNSKLSGAKKNRPLKEDELDNNGNENSPLQDLSNHPSLQAAFDDSKVSEKKNENLIRNDNNKVIHDDDDDLGIDQAKKGDKDNGKSSSRKKKKKKNPGNVANDVDIKVNGASEENIDDNLKHDNKKNIESNKKNSDINNEFNNNNVSRKKKHKNKDDCTVSQIGVEDKSIEGETKSDLLNETFSQNTREKNGRENESKLCGNSDYPDAEITKDPPTSENICFSENQFGGLKEYSTNNENQSSKECLDVDRRCNNVDFDEKVNDNADDYDDYDYDYDYDDGDDNNNNNNENIKYKSQKYRYFLKYNEGIKIDPESWFAVTPELLAAHTAKRMDLMNQPKIVIDGFCGVGGNLIQFAKYSHPNTIVFGIEVNPQRIKLTVNNAKIYGVRNKIEFIIGDFIKIHRKLKGDVVFLSPSWGGPKYIENEVFDLSQIQPIDGRRLYKMSTLITNNICYYLPKNTDVTQIFELTKNGESVEIERNYYNSNLKSLTVYFGDLVSQKSKKVYITDKSQIEYEHNKDYRETKSEGRIKQFLLD